VASGAEAVRMRKASAVSIDDTRVDSLWVPLDSNKEYTLRVGKKRKRVRVPA
jgi:hypothetical protein